MIPLNDFRREPEELVQRQLEAMERVLRSGWYILGREVESFEERWAAECQTAQCIGVANGMDAIEIGLRALGIREGDEVITTPLTAFASVLAIIRAGATPVLADVNPATGLLDRSSVERCLSERTRAVLLVHLYGRVDDLEGWSDWCRARGIWFVEDCAQSHGASWQGRPAGSWGAFGAYSFYPTKNLGTCGDGGALVTSNAVLAARARVLRNYGQSERYHHPVLGLNSRLDELHAGILSARLPYLADFTLRRRAVAAAYRGRFVNPLVTCLAPGADPLNEVHHLFVVRCAERDRLQRHLAASGVGTLVHYPIPVHHQEPCRDLRRDPAGLVEAERFAADCLSLPCHPFLRDDEVAQVCEAINAFS